MLKALFLLISLTAFAIDPDEALKRLMDGNQRYIKNELQHHFDAALRREETKMLQTPFAAILGCSDSRVPPEIIFDQGVGDLFAVRIAGNVAGPVGIDSLDYSVKYLGAKLILVLGHESCGAVKAVLDGTTEDIQAVAAIIYPAVKGAKSVEAAVKANIRSMVEHLKGTPLLKKMLKEKKIQIRGAYYHLGSGVVELL